MTAADEDGERMVAGGHLPERVAAADDRAKRVGFGLSCEPLVGQLLATLTAAVPARGRILELGTGVGVGLAWLVQGSRDREVVEVVTVEIDGAVANVAREGDWPPNVMQLVGDAVALLPGLGQFDLIFADAQGGKWTGLELTIAALRRGGVLVVDDMDLTRYSNPEDRATVAEVRRKLMGHEDLVAVEIPASSGIIIATRR